MSYKIKTSTKVSTSMIFADLKSNIESLLKLLTEKWNIIPKILVNLNQELSGAYQLSYSIDVNGNYFHISTKGENLGQMAENLKNNLFSIKTQTILINTNKQFNHEVRNQNQQKNQNNFCFQRTSQLARQPQTNYFFEMGICSETGSKSRELRERGVYAQLFNRFER